VKLENRFTVPVPVAQAWEVLLDVERIAPCMPGATLTGSEGDSHTGTVKVKVGPINLTYGGTMTFVSRDEAARVVVLEGSGKETRGTGTAKAQITCRLLDRGDTTDVEVDTDLNVTGKPASFGRGVLGDVSGKIVDQFAACLADEIRSGQPSAAPDPTATMPLASPSADPGSTPSAGPASGSREATGSASAADGGRAATGPAPAAAPTAAPRPAAPRVVREVEPIDLLGTAGAPVLKRLAPVLAALAVLVLVVRRLRR
jgi:uncharacterized protein